MISPRDWTLSQRATALVVVVVALLMVLGAAAAAVASANRAHLSTVLERIGPMRVSAERLAAAAADQDSALRRYALTAEPGDLDSYYQGRELERTTLAAMDGVVGPYPGVQDDLDLFRARTQTWRDTVAQPVIDAVQRGEPAVAETLLGDQTRQQTDQIRAAGEALQAAVADERTRAAGQARDTANTLVALLIVAAVVVLLAGTAMVLLLRRLVTAPVTDLAAQVQLVAAGDYQHQITATGAGELVHLAENVERMRRKIVSDLGEVRAARRQVEQAMERLEAQTEELTRSNRDLEQFAYVASHDLQEPLRKVASFCQLLQRRYAGQLDERADQYIAFAVNGAQRMQRLINDLLAFSRIGRSGIGDGEVDLERVAADVVAQLDEALERTGGEVVRSGLPTVRGEESLLANLLGNLVGNALKFRRPDVPPRVEVTAERRGDEWEISCVDNGIGIESEFADKVFVIFQRLHPKETYPGTGIGLSIAKKIVEHHGGRIWVDRERTVGTAIRFTLPVAPADRVGSAGVVGPEPADDRSGQVKETIG